MTDTPTQTVRGEVAKRAADPKPIAVAKSYEHALDEVLPEHIPVKAFIGAAAGALRRNPELMKAAEASPGSLMNALMECATLGHVPGSKEYYLTPRWNGKAQHTEILGIEGYRGVIERMFRSGAVSSVIVEVVHAKDDYEYVRGMHDKPIHHVQPFSDDRGEMIGGYSYAVLSTGAVSRVVEMSKAEILSYKERSDAGKKGKGPWVTDEKAMWLKTLAHRLEPWVPTSAEYRREALRAVAAADNVRRERGLPPSNVDPATGEVLGDVVDAELVEGES